MKFTQVIVLALIVLCANFISHAQTTEFTYQGSLKDGGNPANGNYDLEFDLYDNLLGGSQIGMTIPRNGVAITNGAFTQPLDFGNQFPGAARFLEVRVRRSGGPAGFTTLLPRQPVNSSPYSIKSLAAANAAQLGGVDAGRYVQQDANGNVSITGGLTVNGSLSLDTVNAATQYNLGGQRIFSAPAGSNLFAGDRTSVV